MERFLDILQSAPPEAWVGLLGVVIGSLLTTLGVWLTNRANAKQTKMQLEHDDKRHRQRVAKERLEELYILVCHWQSGMFAHSLNLTLVMKDQTDYNQYLDSVIATKSGEGVDFKRLEMILDVYGTADVRSAYAGAIQARTHLNEIMNMHKAAYRRGEPGAQFLSPFNQAQLAFSGACDGLKAVIASSARDA